MARIHILSPGSPCRNPRPFKEAQTLGAAGHDVLLLTQREPMVSADAESQLCRNAPFRHEALPLPAGLGAHAARVATRIACEFNSLGWEQRRSLGHLSRWRRRVLSLPVADLTIVHNELPFLLGGELLAQGQKVAADFEDWYSEDLLPADRRGRPVQTLRQIEQLLLRGAAYTSTTSAALAAALQRRYGGRHPHVISNSFPLQSVPDRPEPGPPPAFFWFSQTIGPGRGLEEFCAAWRLTKQPSRLVLLGQPVPEFIDSLRPTLAPDHTQRLELLPLVTPDQLPKVIARHEIGLALEQTPIPSRDLTITNKILQYLNAGLAIIATPTSGQREVMDRSPGAGWMLDFSRPAETAASLDRIITDPAALTTARNAARNAAETHYCWEHEGPRLVDIVAQALAT